MIELNSNKRVSIFFPCLPIALEHCSLSLLWASEQLACRPPGGREVGQTRCRPASHRLLQGSPRRESPPVAERLPSSNQQTSSPPLASPPPQNPKPRASHLNPRQTPTSQDALWPRSARSLLLSFPSLASRLPLHCVRQPFDLSACALEATFGRVRLPATLPYSRCAHPFSTATIP